MSCGSPEYGKINGKFGFLKKKILKFYSVILIKIKPHLQEFKV